MLRLKRCFRSLTIAVLLAAAVTITGCAARVGVGYRVYDPYFRDYHVWTDGEAAHYHSWAIENRHEHRDYRQLNSHDQQEYWRWRHDHPDGH
jgi:hypothetical protein